MRMDCLEQIVESDCNAKCEGRKCRRTIRMYSTLRLKSEDGQWEDGLCENGL